MRPVRPVYIAAQAVTHLLGRATDFILKGHPDFGKRENPTLEDHLVCALSASCWRNTRSTPV